MHPDRAQLEREFRHIPKAELKHGIAKGDLSGRDISLWLEFLEEDERTAAVARANESLEVARKAAEAAERAAVAAENSAKYTRAAAWGSAIAAVVALAAAVLGKSAG